MNALQQPERFQDILICWLKVQLHRSDCLASPGITPDSGVFYRCILTHPNKALASIPVFGRSEHRSIHEKEEYDIDASRSSGNERSKGEERMTLTRRTLSSWSSAKLTSWCCYRQSIVSTDNPFISDEFSIVCFSFHRTRLGRIDKTSRTDK